MAKKGEDGWGWRRRVEIKWQREDGEEGWGWRGWRRRMGMDGHGEDQWGWRVFVGMESKGGDG